MLSVTLIGLVNPCNPISGGIARLWIFDPADFDWTQPAAVGGIKQKYSAVALRAPGGGVINTGKMYPIQFEEFTGELTYKQSRKGCSVKYENQLQFSAPNVGQVITTWNETIDAAGCCNGVGIVAQANSGKIFVLGEQYVNGSLIPIPLKMKQDGSSATTGKLLDDDNAQDTILKGDYIRAPYEYGGVLDDIVALQAP